LKHKDLIGIPWRVAFALQADGWYLRQDIIWHKPNPMPESVTDRCTKAHEYVFMLTKNAKYYFDSAANQVPASSSFAKDKRHITGSNDNHDKPGFAAAGAQDSKGPHRVFSKRSAANSFKRPAKEAQIPGQAALQHRTDRAESTYDVMTANRRSVWTVTTKPFKGAHFATFPPDLIEPCVLTSSRPGDMVLDPFGGAGTTGVVAQRHGRPSILLELNADYCRLIEERLKKEMGNGQTTRV
jgi:DNA modification methylase